MPYINIKTSIPVPEERQIAVKTALGQSMSLMGKSEKYVMIGFEDNIPMYFGGEKQEYCAFVDIKVFGEVDPTQADNMTEMVCRTLDMCLQIPPENVYVTYQGISDWGWNGKNF